VSSSPPATASAPAENTEASNDALSIGAGPTAVRGGALRVGGYLIGAPVSALSAALIFRHLGRVDSGLYIAAASLVAIVAVFSDLGLTAVGVREISTLPANEGWSLARDLLGLRIALTVIGVVIVTIVAAIAYSMTLADGVALAGVGLLLQVTQDNFAIPLTVGLRFGWVAGLELLRQILTTTCTVLLVILGASIVPFLGVTIPVGTAVLLITVILVRGVRGLAPTFSLHRWRAFTKSMVPYAIAVAASGLYFRVAVLLVSALSDRIQLGYFGISFRMIEVLTLVPALVATSAFPIFARAAGEDHDRLGYALGRVFDVSLILGSWVAVSIAIGAPLGIAIIGGPEFKDAAPVLAVEGIALGAMFVSTVWAYGLLSLGLYKRILVLNLSALALNAVLVTILVISDGAQGAALGTALAEVILASAQCVAVVYGRPALRPSLGVLARIPLAIVLGLLPFLLTGVPTIARLLISTVLFAGGVWITKALPREVLDAIPRRGSTVGRSQA
jgi:O-antigen/teichoic acid export membrane protein